MSHQVLDFCQRIVETTVLSREVKLGLLEHS